MKSGSDDDIGGEGLIVSGSEEWLISAAVSRDPKILIDRRRYVVISSGSSETNPELLSR